MVVGRCYIEAWLRNVSAYRTTAALDAFHTTNVSLIVLNSLNNDLTMSLEDSNSAIVRMTRRQPKTLTKAIAHASSIPSFLVPNRHWTPASLASKTDPIPCA